MSEKERRPIAAGWKTIVSFSLVGLAVGKSASG
jgi:hypothetical protein